MDYYQAGLGLASAPTTGLMEAFKLQEMKGAMDIQGLQTEALKQQVHAGTPQGLQEAATQKARGELLSESIKSMFNPDMDVAQRGYETIKKINETSTNSLGELPDLGKDISNYHEFAQGLTDIMGKYQGMDRVDKLKEYVGKYPNITEKERKMVSEDINIASKGIKTDTEEAKMVEIGAKLKTDPKSVSPMDQAKYASYMEIKSASSVGGAKERVEAPFESPAMQNLISTHSKALVEGREVSSDLKNAGFGENFIAMTTAKAMESNPNYNPIEADIAMPALRENQKRETLTRDFVNRIDNNITTIHALQQKYGPNYGRLFNSVMNLIKQKITGSGDLEALRLAITSTSNEVSKIESGSLGIAGASVEQMQIIGKIHDLALNPEDMNIVLDTSSTLGKNSVMAIADENTRLRNKITGKKELNMNYPPDTPWQTISKDIQENSKGIKKEDADKQAKKMSAEQYLKAHKQKVTDANIDYVIKQRGW